MAQSYFTVPVLIPDAHLSLCCSYRNGKDLFAQLSHLNGNPITGSYHQLNSVAMRTVALEQTSCQEATWYILGAADRSDCVRCRRTDRQRHGSREQKVCGTANRARRLSGWYHIRRTYAVRGANISGFHRTLRHDESRPCVASSLASWTRALILSGT